MDYANLHDFLEIRFAFLFASAPVLLPIEYCILNNLCTYLASRSLIDPAMLRHDILYGVGKVKK